MPPRVQWAPCPHPHLSLIFWRPTLCPLLLAFRVTHPVRIESSSSHVAEGQSLDLNCLVVGHAHPQISWYKRGGSLPARHQVGGGEAKEGTTEPSWLGSREHSLGVQAYPSSEAPPPLTCWLTLGKLLDF